jgi:transcriptional regulator GlxA family with amidase domain
MVQDPPNQMTLRVDVVALDGVLDAALGVTLDVLAAADRLARVAGRPEPFRVSVLSARRWIRTGTGRRVSADATLARRRRSDVLVVLGMNLPTVSELDRALARSDVRAAISMIRRESERKTLVCASCSATFLCAEAGLLDGRAAATSWWLGPVFRQRYPAVRLRDDAMVVSDGGVVTAGAALSQVDLMLWLTRRVAGPAIAELCTRYLVIDERPSQMRYVVVDQLTHQSDEITRAEAFARGSLHKPIGVEDLARAAGTSERTLERRFREALGMTPMRFLQRIRVERAAHLLQTTKRSLEEVAERVGYESSSSLRRVLQRELGVSASGLRRRPR